MMLNESGSRASRNMGVLEESGSSSGCGFIWLEFNIRKTSWTVSVIVMGPSGPA